MQPPHFPGDGQKVRQCLGGVVVLAVTGVDDGDGGVPGGYIGGAVPGMADGHDVGIAAEDLSGVRHALTLGGGGGAGLGEADDAAPQLQHGSFKAQPGPGGGLEKQGCQLLVPAAFPVVFRPGDNVLGGGDQLVQLFYGQVQNTDQASHAFAPFTARYFRIRATFSALAGFSSRYSIMSYTSTTE